MSEQIQEQQNEHYIEQLCKAVDEEKISNWTVTKRKVKRNNLYMEKDYKIESLLASEREEVVVRIFTEEGEEVGESSFNILPSISSEAFSSKLENNITMCSQAKSKKYKIPDKDDKAVEEKNIDPTSFFNKEFVEQFENNTLNVFLAEQLALLKSLVEQKQTKDHKVVVNALEFFNKMIQEELNISTGIKKEFTSTSSYLELILTCKDNSTGKETEHILYQNINDLFTFDYTHFFTTAIESVIATSQAQSASSFKGKVLLSEAAVHNFFTPDLRPNTAIAHAFARIKYMGLSKYEIGEPIIEAIQDTLTIYANPLLKGNNASRPYDDLGITSKRTCLIENGVLKHFAGSKQYTDYLGVEPTGSIGSVEVSAGTQSEEQLLSDSDEMILIHTFSSFVPDMVSGDFSAEIRLGFRINEGKKEAFKGGLFSGNIFELLKHIELSQEEVEESGYKGPKTIKFHHGEVVGL